MAVVWSASVVRSGGAWPRLVGPVGSPEVVGALGRVVRVYRGFRPVPRWLAAWAGAGAAIVAVAVCLAAGQWWPAPVVAAGALAAAGAYGRLRRGPGLRAVRLHEGGLVLVGPANRERPLPWGAVEASEHARIWLVGVDEPVRLARVHGLDGLLREVDERLAPTLRAGLHRALREEGCVRFARGRLTVTTSGLVHRPSRPPAVTEAFRWAEVRSARATGPGELEIRTGSAGLPLCFAVPNARAAAEFLEEVRAHGTTDNA
ncbi:hypothetical protein [Kitasatospora sp. NPDC101183]|uniref:hypothetical protein n=1 Tax=Kitasatospora sp. NPDC101183 TaxID=3364100 RepID=UPI0038153650